MSPAFTPRSTRKAKSRSTGWKDESSSTGFARVALSFGSGMRSRITSKPTSGPSARKRLERARMQLAEIAEHVLRADLDRARATGMQPSRSARHDLQRPHRGAGRRQGRERIGLGIEGIDLAGLARPMAAAPGGFCQRAPHARRGGQLVRPAGRRGRSGRPRTAPRRRCRDRHCAGRRQSAPGPGSAACPTGRPRSGWRAQAQAGRRRTAPPAAWR